MDENITVYCKRAGEPRVPVTVRIEWMPDGTILPRFFWTPDGFCYRVMPGHKCVALAFLKERGRGLRFEVTAVVVKTPGYDDDLLSTRCETYLYLADDWFCGKGFIDARYGHPGKEYVPVTLDVFPDCGYEIVYFRARGARYAVRKTFAVEPRGSYSAGGVGVWHGVEARLVNDGDDEDPDPGNSVLRPDALYFEINKWFVAVR